MDHPTTTLFFLSSVASVEGSLSRPFSTTSLLSGADWTLSYSIGQEPSLLRNSLFVRLSPDYRRRRESRTAP